MMSSHEATAQAAHDDDLDDDPVISKIRKTGCLEKHFDVLVSDLLSFNKSVIIVLLLVFCY